MGKIKKTENKLEKMRQKMVRERRGEMGLHKEEKK